jgi:hypothetical protein
MQERTRELNNWLSAQKCQATVEALKRNNFRASFLATGAEAAEYILREAADAQSIGFGGSLSVADLKLTQPLLDAGKELLNHGVAGLTPEQKKTVMRRQQSCDLFLSGTNAVTTGGSLVNIDGVGNRVSAMIYGPEKIIILAGRNKIVEGDIGEALQRIHNESAPPNAKRLDKKTPCAQSGFCCDCDSPERICRVITVIERKPSASDIHVLVVNEDMGL